MLVELRRAPTFFVPRGFGMSPHSEAVVGRSVDQKLGEVEFFFDSFHTNALGGKKQSLKN